MTTQAARRPPPVPHAHIHLSARSTAASSSKDLEAVGPPSRTASGAGLDSRHRTLFWVALVVLVAACATAAIVLGVGMGKSKGSSSSSSSEHAAPVPQQPPPAAAGNKPAAGAAPASSTPAGAASAGPPAAAAPPPAAGPADNVMQGTPPFFVPSGFTALWWDEFDGLDTGKWALGAGPPANSGDGLQTYTASPANVAVANGNLSITAVKDGTGYTSARLDTKASGSWYPGMQLPDGRKVKSVHVAARIKLPPPSKGLQATLHMLPVTNKYGGWPASGEIVVMGSVDMKEAVQAIRYGDAWPADEKSEVKSKLSTDEQYHTFAVDWERDTFTMRIDSEKTKSFEEWWTAARGAKHPAPFDQPFYLILDLSVGTSWAGQPDASTPASASMVVDYVRVFAKMAS
ncbi:hypothetical protein ABPG77_008921 [Micractinium sp. CCAP 211/92]